MKPITEVIRDKELEMQRVREEMEALLRQKEQHIKGIEAEIETLRAAAKIIGESAAPTQPAPVAAPPAPPVPVVEHFPAQPAHANAAEPVRKRWP